MKKAYLIFTASINRHATYTMYMVLVRRISRRFAAVNGPPVSQNWTISRAVPSTRTTRV